MPQIIPMNDTQITDIRVLEDDQILCFEESTSDLVKYNSDFTLISRLPGKMPLGLGKYPLLTLEETEIITTLHSGSKDTHLWIMGDTSLGIVNLNSMSIRVINEMFGVNSQELIPVSAIYNSNEDKVVALSIVNAEISLSFKRTGAPIRRKGQKVIFTQGMVDL